MKQSANTLNNNHGAAVITAAIMILAVITILGIASQQVSNTEVRIAGYESVYLQNLYSAESAAIESVEILDTLNSPSAAGLPWIETTVDNLTMANILNKSFWTAGNGSVTPEPSTVMPDSQHVVVYQGIVAGSLGIGSTKKHAYAVYGRSAPPNRGEAIVQVGYLVAFK